MRRGSLVHSPPAVVMLMCMFSSIVHGQQYIDETASNVAANERNGSLLSSLFILGDSSVDCGDNTLLYPLLHGRLSLYPCNGSDSSLLPQLIGTLLFLFLMIYSKTQIVILDIAEKCNQIWLMRLQLGRNVVAGT